MCHKIHSTIDPAVAKSHLNTSILSQQTEIPEDRSAMKWPVICPIKLICVVINFQNYYSLMYFGDCSLFSGLVFLPWKIPHYNPDIGPRVLSIASQFGRFLILSDSSAINFFSDFLNRILQVSLLNLAND